jgi:2-amino-4-hydroxy-6-hydroxymethyldihydropteridine diphosphokinase
MAPHIAYVSIGSNIGQKRLNCQKGIFALKDSEISFLTAQSQFYKTEPVDYKDQNWFVNAVVKIETHAGPLELLKALMAIEAVAGRKRSAVKFGPRIIDLDIILYDDLVMRSRDLELPHPRMHKRRFVLRPMCDIGPHVIHPVLGKDMQNLLDGLDENQQEVIRYL